MLNQVIDIAAEAGRSLLDTFGRSKVLANKGDYSNVVTEADTRAEALIVRRIRESFPTHSIIAEETGTDLRDPDITWVVDPLDGTSNYAAGIPWFGVLIAVLHRGVPIAGVMHLPAIGDTYAAQAGSGATRNGQSIAVTRDAALSQVLWAYGMDGGVDDAQAQRNVAILARLLRRVRNVRATNSLVDAAYVADGRLGGMLNQSTRLWDIAAPMLIVQEAGGLYTHVTGRPLVFDISATACDKEYAVLAAPPHLHREVVAVAAEACGPTA